MSMMKNVMAMRWVSVGMCILVHSTAQGANRQWKGTDTVNNRLMTRNENWVGVRPVAGDKISFNSAFVLSGGQPNMNDDFLTEQLAAASSLIRDVKMTGNTANDMRLRSLNGIGLDNNGGQELWFDMNGMFYQDDNVYISGSPNTNRSTVTWITRGSNSTTVVSTGMFRIEANMILETRVESNVLDIRTGISNSDHNGNLVNKWVTKIGAGTLILGGQNQWRGATTIDEGVLQLAVDNAITNVSDLIFNDGTTLKTGGYDGDFDKVDVNGTVTFDFESLGTSQISFKDSSSVAWGTTLNMINYTEGSDSVRFGTDANGLTPTQLAGITVNGVSGYSLDSDGYLVLAAPADEQEWVGGTNSDWYVAANWASNSVPGTAGVAIFDASFASSNSQPTVTSNAVVDELRVIAPGQDVVITVGSGAILGVAQASLNLANAVSDLTISGDGGFVQLAGNDSDPLWDVTSTNGGDLTIDTDALVISNGVALSIDVDAARTVSINTGADATSASVTKTGEGLLILGGSNGWSGDTTISGGTLQLAADNALAADSALILNDGTILDTDGFDGSFGTLEVNGSVIIDMAGAGTNELAFADSSAVAWGSSLAITNFTEGIDSVRFGTNSTGLAEVQLADITLNGEGNLVLDDSGYLVVGPVPVGEVLPGTAAGAGVTLTWGGVVGQSYNVQYKTNLMTGAWMTYTNIPGAGGDITITSSVINAAEFYRVTSEFSE
jgi:autotransporter-associated beta strand protein